VGLWIPNFFYWGLNQYITQRTLGSRSLAQGQKGIVFAAFLKLIIPFIVVIPGILAFNLFHNDLQDDAVRRNALILAEKSPQLYQRLSDAVKPDPAEERNRVTLQRVSELLAKAASEPRNITLYKFRQEFAEVHPEDAAAIIDYSLQQAGEGLSRDSRQWQNASPGELAEYSAALAAQAEAQLTDQLQVEELVSHDYDNAFPTLIRRLLPIGCGIKGFVLAAIFGAVVSSLASMLNSASTIATMDVYRKIHRTASQYTLVTVGRICVVLFVLIATGIAPLLGHPRFGGIFNFIQEFQGFISPGILAIFLFGLLVHRAPRSVGTVGLILNPLLYGMLKLWVPRISFLDRMAICFFVVAAVLTTITLLRPLAKPVDLPVNPQMDMQTSRGAIAFGVLVVCLTLGLYIVFW
jgi:SSS family solute:Na+ symporter